MKASAWLSLSVAANVALAGIIIYQSLSRPAAPPPAISPVAEKAPASNAVSSATTSTRLSPPANLAEWIQQSRAAGVPERLLSTVIEAEFNQRWEKRQRDFDRRYEQGLEDDNARQKFEQEKERQLESAMKAALGEKGFHEWDKRRLLTDFDVDGMNLNPSESDALYTMRKNFLARSDALQAQVQAGQIDEADLSRQMNASQAEYDAKVKALLGDQRYALTQHSNDPAGDLRRTLRTVQVDDRQFSTLLQADQTADQQRAQLEQQLSSGAISEQEHQRRLAAIEQAKEQAFQNTMGPAAYAEYQKAQDDRYNTLKHYAPAWQLSSADIDYLYRAMRDYEDTVSEYRARTEAIQQQGQPVNWDGVQKTIQQYKQSTAAALRSYLGDARFSKLSQNEVLQLSE